MASTTTAISSSVYLTARPLKLTLISIQSSLSMANVGILRAMEGRCPPRAHARRVHPRYAGRRTEPPESGRDVSRRPNRRRASSDCPASVRRKPPGRKRRTGRGAERGTCFLIRKTTADFGSLPALCPSRARGKRKNVNAARGKYSGTPVCRPLPALQEQSWHW